MRWSDFGAPLIFCFPVENFLQIGAFFLILGKPGKYGLPEQPKLPQRNVVLDSLFSIGSAVAVGLGALLAFRGRGDDGDGGRSGGGS